MAWKNNRLLILLIVIAFFSYMLMDYRSGSYSCRQTTCGYFFWGSHGHDGIWHIAVAENAFKQIPFAMPTYAGARLAGYNYLLDLPISLLSRIGLPPIFTYFKLIPTVWFIIYTVLLIALARKIIPDRRFIFLFLFFTYFTGSFSFFFTLARDKTIYGSAELLAQTIANVALNLQFALSLLSIIYILIKMTGRKIGRRQVVIFGVLIFINMGLKFYGGSMAAILVGSYLLVTLFRRRRILLVNLTIIALFFFASIIIFYDPFTAVKSGAIFQWSPMRMVHSITEDPHLFYLPTLTNARYAYAATGQLLKLIPIELFNLTAFGFFYLGVRFIGLLYAAGLFFRKKINSFDLSVVVTIGFSIFMTTFFVQKGEWTNIIQFFYYGVFLSTIYLARFAYILMKKKTVVSYAIVGILMLLAVPATIDTIRLYAQSPTVYLPAGEMEALQALKKLPDGIVLSPLYNDSPSHQYAIKELLEKRGPLPLYAWNDTAYVAAFSGKQSFLADLWMERITGVEYEKRLSAVTGDDCRILKGIRYIYHNNHYKISRKLFDCGPELKLIWGNLTATIYEVDSQSGK